MASLPNSNSVAPPITSDQLQGQVRTWLIAAGIYLSAHGIPALAPYVTDIAGLGTAILMAIWSWKSNSSSNLVLAAADQPQVTSISVKKPDFAQMSDHHKVLAA